MQKRSTFAVSYQEREREVAFTPGQLVVCVDDQPFEGRTFGIKRGALVRGSIYTIRDYVPQADWVKPLYADEKCVRLHEIERWHDDIGFRESRFRPVDKIKKSIVRKRKESV